MDCPSPFEIFRRGVTGHHDQEYAACERENTSTASERKSLATRAYDRLNSQLRFTNPAGTDVTYDLGRYGVLTE